MEKIEKLFKKRTKNILGLKEVASLLTLFTFLFSNALVSLTPKVEAVTATQLFYSGMEEATFSDWGFRDTDWQQTGSDYKCENKSAAVKGDTMGDADIISPAISTVGYSNINLSFWYRIAESLECGDYVRVQWSVDNTNWNILAVYTNLNARPWTYQNLPLPSGAEDQSNLKIRFRANLDKYYHSDKDEFRLDCVKLTGIPAAECTVDADCDDSLYCNGSETCVAGECVQGTQIDCSGNNLLEIATCTNEPDGIPFTWDWRAAFISQCNEDTDTCTLISDETITHTCDVTQCDAECDTQNPCADTVCGEDGCQGNDYHDYSDVPNTCQGDCTCTQNECGDPVITYNSPSCTECQTDDDCDDLDEDYCEGTVRKHNEGKCIDYSCIAETTESVDCDDGLACTGTESCSLGECVKGTSVDCSSNNLLEIATCTNEPDGIPFTWDWREAFTSICQEPDGTCSIGDETINHACDMKCEGCECVNDTDCGDQDPYTTDTCNLTTCQCEYITEPVYGCTDPEASNYDPNATVDDDSCEYDVYGCTDPEADNYNPEATIDDESCTYPEEPVYGCTDPMAINYNSGATRDDGSCTYGGAPIGGQRITPPGQVLGEEVVEECGLYLLEYIQYGADNNPEEVKKLQVFLNDYMGSNLPITGIYDLATMQVVNQFQVQCKEQVLRPWVEDGGTLCDENQATGYVYKTTQRWINLIMCPTLDLPMPDLSGYYPKADCVAYQGEVLGEEALAQEDGMTDGADGETEEGEEPPTEDEIISLDETEGETETEEREAPTIWLIIVIIIVAVVVIWFVYKGMRR